MERSLTKWSRTPFAFSFNLTRSLWGSSSKIHERWPEATDVHSFSLFEIEKEIPGEPKYDSLGDCFKVLFQSEIPSSPTVRHVKRKEKGQRQRHLAVTSISQVWNLVSQYQSPPRRARAPWSGSGSDLRWGKNKQSLEFVTQNRNQGKEVKRFRGPLKESSFH